MNPASALVALIVLICTLVSQGETPELKVLQVEYANLLNNRVMDAYNEGLAKLDTNYLGGVDRSLASAKSAGDLEDALSLEAEKKRVASKEALPINDEHASKSLKKLRAVYRLELAKLDAQRASGQAALLTPYIGKLKQLESDLTKADRLADAKAVMDYRQGVAAGVPMKAVVAVGASTTTPLPPVAPVTPPPPAITSPAQTPTAMPSGAAIEVASEMKARSDVKDVAKEAIVFEGPGGSGRRYTKGVLLKNDSLTGKNGSTWAFKYTRSGGVQGVQIIHPHGSGQMICHLHKDAVGISTPAVWTESGYGKGDVSRMMKKKAFADFFPLKEAEEYQVVSKLDGQGGYELTINGKIVATTHVTKTSPLSLEMTPEAKSPGVQGFGTTGFKGNDFPLQWAAGYAAVLLGPLEVPEQNVCREIQFWPGVKK